MHGVRIVRVHLPLSRLAGRILELVFDAIDLVSKRVRLVQKGWSVGGDD